MYTYRQRTQERQAMMHTHAIFCGMGTHIMHGLLHCGAAMRKSSITSVLYCLIARHASHSMNNTVPLSSLLPASMRDVHL